MDTSVLRKVKFGFINQETKTFIVTSVDLSKIFINGAFIMFDHHSVKHNVEKGGLEVNRIIRCSVNKNYVISIEELVAGY